jgi:hypothetical protein
MSVKLYRTLLVAFLFGLVAAFAQYLIMKIEAVDSSETSVKQACAIL